MPSLHRYALAALLLAAPLVAAQGPPGAEGGAQGPSGDQGQEQGKLDHNEPPPPPAPENASANQGDETQANYPQWYSNDYDCVINCMQVFNGVTSRERNATLDTSWLSCINQACDKQYASQNIYQGFYIAEMFYDTGSIYECDGAPCEPQPAPSSAAPGTGATDASGAGVATGPGGDDHTASTAVSMSDLKTTVKTTATGTGTSSEPAATETGAGNGAGRVDWSLGMGIAAAMAWGAVAML